MIDAHATTATCADPHRLARDLAETLLKIEHRDKQRGGPSIHQPHRSHSR
jgi:hypothetical protein